MLPTEQNITKDTTETTTLNKNKGVELSAQCHEQDEDQLSDSSLNYVTPSPKSVARDIDDIDNDDSDIEASAIEISSDDRISSEEMEIISEKCPSKCEWFVALGYVRGLPTTKRLNRLVRLWFRIQELDNFRIVDGRVST